MKLYMYRWRREGGVVRHCELLRLFSFTHPFWACLGGLQPYMPRRPETWVLLWNIWWNADACRSARLSSGRIVLRVTQVAMRGNSCIHPIDLISNTLLLVVKNGVEIVGTSMKWKVLVLTTILVPPQVYFVSFIRHSIYTNSNIIIFLET